MKNRTLLLIGLGLLAGWFLLRHGPGLMGTPYDMGPRTVKGGMYGGGQ